MSGGTLTSADESFVLGMISNLIAAAVIYLVATAAHLIDQPKGVAGMTGVSVLAVLFVLWSACGLFMAAEFVLGFTVMSVVAIGGLVLEILVLLRHHSGWATAGLIVATVFAGLIPGWALDRVRTK
jgi:hypothetical protein